MTLRYRLIILQFLQYFVFGSWLLTIGAYWFQTRGWSGTEFGAIFSTIGLASLFMPALAGVIADRWVNAEKLYGLFHLAGALTLFYIPQVDSPGLMFWVMLLYMVFYTPTIPLSVTVSYAAIKGEGLDVVRDYPPIRVWGTVGFVVALWTISLSNLETSSGQFLVASAASVVLAVFSFAMPGCPPLGKSVGGSWVDNLGLRGFSLLKIPHMAIFFFFVMFLGAALQLSSAYGDTFLHDFAAVEEFRDSFAVRHPAVILSISQISEMVFILAIPFFMRRYGIKAVLLISLIAWALRFGLFAYGDPGSGLWMIILSCVVYGVAFNFFHVSGSLFVETQVAPGMRASGQGLFFMMSNGFGAFFGSLAGGVAIDRYFEVDGNFDWQGIWLAFAGFSALTAMLWIILFRNPVKSGSNPNNLRSGPRLPR
ncbi:MAG: nucleoside permease [Gammaproteobacteria bacterium]|nr:nucleoside permease [Gammaproteobacteria bacterium]MDH4256282.1 nucleoside permease [Gammaproteobacteria bacterium]